MGELDIRFELNPAKVFQTCPEESGVYTIEDREGDVLLIAHATNLAQAVTRHLPENELRNVEIRKHGRYFRFFLTEDPEEVSRIFDVYVERRGRFPRGMAEAPEASRWAGKPDPGASSVGPPAAPSGEGPAAARPAASPEAQVGPRSARVLLIASEVQLLVLMKEYLELEGHQVSACANPKMFEDASKAGVPFDVAVVELGVPGLQTGEVLGRVRAGNPEALLLLVTDPQHRDQAYALIQSGVRKIFPKPFSMKMLCREIAAPRT